MNTYYWIYPIYTGILAIALIVLVPKKNIRKLFPWGIIVGGIGDISAILLFTKLLGVGGYINFGPFGFKGIPFFPLLAWSIWFIMYFYFFPVNSTYLKYIYVFTAAAYSVIFSNILINLNIFYWNYGNIIIPFLIYISWFSVAIWIKYKK